MLPWATTESAWHTNRRKRRSEARELLKKFKAGGRVNGDDVDAARKLLDAHHGSSSGMAPKQKPNMKTAAAKAKARAKPTPTDAKAPFEEVWAHWMCSKCAKNKVTYAVKGTGEPMNNCHVCNMRLGNCHLFWCDKRGDQIVPTIAMSKYLAEERAACKSNKDKTAKEKARKGGPGHRSRRE